MVLYHIFKCTRLIIVTTSVLNTNRFSKGNLDIIDKFFVPNMFKQDISKTNSENILNHLNKPAALLVVCYRLPYMVRNCKKYKTIL